MKQLTSGDGAIEKYMEENRVLRSRMMQMDKFLLEYGIKWVEDTPNEDAHKKVK